MKRKRQHYVPQFYLRMFARKDKAFSVFVVDKGIIIPNAPYTTQCYEDYMYGEDEVWETRLIALEGEWASIFGKICRSPEGKLTPMEEERIRSFAIFQKMRTTDSRDTLVSMKEKAYEDITRIVAQFYGISNAKEEVDETIRELKVSIKKRQEAATCLKLSSEISPTISDLHLLVVHNRTKVNYISSDNPIICMNQFSPNHAFPMFAGLVYSFPISPRIAIFLFDAKMYSAFSNQSFIYMDDPLEVHGMNLCQYANCTSILFGDVLPPLLALRASFNQIKIFRHNLNRSGISFHFLELPEKAKSFVGREEYFFYRNRKEFDISQRIRLLEFGFKMRDKNKPDGVLEEGTLEELQKFRELFEDYQNGRL